MTDILEIKDAWKTYKMGAEEINALQGIDFKLEEKSFLAVMGPSGSGKSTLLHMAGILDLPTRGEIILGGKNISELSGKEQAHLRRNQMRGRKAGTLAGRTDSVCHPSAEHYSWRFEDRRHQ